MMKNQTKYMIIETFVIFAYAYAIQGYSLAAILVSLFAVLMAMECHSAKENVHSAIHALIPAIAIFILDGMCGMLTKMPVLAAPIAASIYCPLAFYQSPLSVMKCSALAELAGFTATLFMIFSMHSITSITRICAMLLTAEVYLPCFVIYVFKFIKVHMHAPKFIIEETRPLR